MCLLTSRSARVTMDLRVRHLMAQTKTKERQIVLDDLYAQIKQHGWVVDVRSFRPTLIKQGTASSSRFDTKKPTIIFALAEIKEGRQISRKGSPDLFLAT